MAKYRIGCCGTGIYVGMTDKTNTIWINKAKITDEAISAVAQYLLENEEVREFSYQGKQYRLAVEPKKSED